MQLDLDVRPPAMPRTWSADLPQPWNSGPILVDDGPLAQPGARPYSFLAECECPGDCLRDHENE